MVDRTKFSITDVSLSDLKERINDWLFQETGGVVQSGPFTGMRLKREDVWKDGSISAKILGTYEQELHPFIEDEIKRLAELANPRIVNIGCAEGYYAVGLARRLPAATVWAIDLAEDAMAIAVEAAELNGASLVTKDTLDHVFAAPDLLVVDCEGAEVKYLDLEAFPALRRSTIIVECHDTEEQPTTRILAERFFDSHQIWLVIEGGRDPNKFDCMRQWHSMARWAAVSEGRPCMMNWFLMRPKVTE